MTTPPGAASTSITTGSSVLASTLLAAAKEVARTSSAEIPMTSQEVVRMIQFTLKCRIAELPRLRGTMPALADECIAIVHVVKTALKRVI